MESIEGSTSKQMNGKEKEPMVRLPVNNIALSVRLSTAKTANAERRLVVCCSVRDVQFVCLSFLTTRRNWEQNGNYNFYGLSQKFLGDLLK